MALPKNNPLNKISSTHALTDTKRFLQTTAESNATTTQPARSYPQIQTNRKPIHKENSPSSAAPSMERQNRESSPPLWRRPQRTASFPSAPGLRQWALVLLFSIFVLLFLPSFLSKGLRPAAGGLIKNGWDALNFLLVLSAILCGLLSRSNNSDDSPTASNSPRRSTPVQTPRFGDGYLSQVPAFGESGQTTPAHRRLRSSSSYPDLRHDWLPAEECRFYDDMYLDRRLPETRSTMATPRHTFSQLANEMPAAERTQSHSISQDKIIINETVTENQSPISRRLRSSSSYTDLRKEWVPADEWRFSDDIQLHRRQPERGSPEVKTIPVDTFKLQSSAPPSPPPPPPRRRRTTRKLRKPDPEQEPPRTPPPPRAPPPPPPPPPPTPPRDPKRHQRKKSVGGAKDLASALAQFYQKKRKKSSSRSKASPDGAASPPAGGGGGGPPPPPPPPPPPSSVFNKLFTHKKSGSKAKRVHTAPPPPPPPPPSKTHISQHSSPLPPTSPHSVRRRRDRSSHANSNLKSPPTPPPPPPPPPSAATSAASAAGEQGRLSCPPSPDVNNKADMFIARFRAGLVLEKQNSIRAKEGQAAPPTDDEEEMVIGTLFDD